MNEEHKITSGEDRITVHPGEFEPTYTTDIHSRTPEERKKMFEELRNKIAQAQAAQAAQADQKAEQKDEESPRLGK